MAKKVKPQRITFGSKSRKNTCSEWSSGLLLVQRSLFPLSLDSVNILAQNQLDASNDLQIGQQLIIPGAKKELPKPVIVDKIKEPIRGN